MDASLAQQQSQDEATGSQIYIFLWTKWSKLSAGGRACFVAARSERIPTSREPIRTLTGGRGDPNRFYFWSTPASAPELFHSGNTACSSTLTSKRMETGKRFLNSSANFMPR